MRFLACLKHTAWALPNCKVRASSRCAGGRVFDWSSQIARLRYYIDSTRTRSRVRPVADEIKRHRTRLITLPDSFRRRTRLIHHREDSIVLNRHLGWEVCATCSNVCHVPPSAASHLEKSIKELNGRMEGRKPTLTPRIISITTRIPQRPVFRQP